MAIMALSIVGLYNADETIFDGLNLPEGMNKVECVHNILFECAELEVVYQDPDYMKTAIANWSTINASVWQKLYDTTVLDYNPIWNVDGTVNEKETRNLAGTDKSVRNVKDNVETDSTIEHDVMGYNVSSGYQNESKDTQHTESEGTTKDTEDRNRTDTGTVERETRRTGNIGVTTTQQMIREEREVALFNMYQQICKDFKNRFCILVY